MKILFSLISYLFLINLNIYAKDDIYFMPNDSKQATKQVVYLLENAEHSIDIAMYNFTYKKFYKAIEKAMKKDVKVTLIYSKTKLKLSKDILLIKPDKKQHIKLAIIDNKYAIYGSANWKKSSFSKNYEILNITDDTQRVEQFIKIIKQLKKEN